MSTPVRDPWIMRPRPTPGAKVRLFCLPHAGGGASSFRGWADFLPAEVEVCPVQLPGRENRIAEKAFDRVEPLAEALSEVVARWGDLPYAVFGHSNGALIGFELARHQRRRGGAQMLHLFASGRRAPDLPNRQRDLHQLGEEELLADLRLLGGIPDALLEHAEMRKLLIPLLRADMALTETYRFAEEPPLEVPITAYGGDADPKAPLEDLRAWARHTTSFRTRVFPGDHFYLASGRDAVLAALSADLRAVLRGEPLRA